MSIEKIVTHPLPYPGCVVGEILSEISRRVCRKKLVSEIIYEGYVDYDALALNGPGSLEPVTDLVGVIDGVDIRVVPEWEPGAMIRVAINGDA